MIAPPCPDRSRLVGYLLGNVSAQELESISDHLDTCAVCTSTAEELESAADPLVEKLRRPLEQPEFHDEPQLGRLLARLRTLHGGEPGAATAQTDLLSPGTRIGVYRIEHALGRGGMGVVYRAWHTQLDRPVALKVLPRERLGRPGAIARFRREMKAVGRLNHPHLVTAHDAGEEGGVPYLAMEFVDGLDLGQLVGQLGLIPVADACELARQAAAGLEYACQQGVVHRDVKPSNLMLTSAGILKVLDLGLARLIDRPAQDELSREGDVLGTLDYMAPEQLSDSREVDARVDVYGLGATLYKLLTGRAPFADAKHRTAVQKIMAVAQEPLPSVESFRSDVPGQLAEVLDRMLAKDRTGRLATPGEVAAALEPFAAGSDLPSVYERACASKAEPKAGLSPTDSVQAVAAAQNRTWARRWWARPVPLAGALLAAVVAIVAVLLSPLGSWTGPDPDDAGEMLRPSIASEVPPKPDIETLLEEPPAATEVLAQAGAGQSGTSGTVATASTGAEANAAPSSTVYPVAVLPFQDRSEDLQLGPQVTDVVTADLGTRPEVFLVERAELERLRAEHQVSLSGAGATAEAVRIGQLTGAKLLVTGSITQLDRSIFLTGKVIGTENGRVRVVSVEGTTNDDLAELAKKLAGRVSEALVQGAGELVPKSEPRPDRVAALRRQLAESKRPSVWIRVAERHIGQPAVDPAAQTELTHLCRETGFEVLDTAEGSRKQADVLIEGEAFSELAGRHGDLVSVKARVEVKAVDRESGQVIDAERQTEVVVDLAEQVAGKTALQKAAAAIAERLLPKLVEE